jgi:hypothetical protein
VTCTITIRLGELAWKALARDGKGAGMVAERLVRAIQMYLREQGADAVSWRYPQLARDVGPGQQVEVTTELDEELWQSLQAEAKRQGVTVEQLVNHAALYVAAEIDSGRATRRILDDFGEPGN